MYVVKRTVRGKAPAQLIGTAPAEFQGSISVSRARRTRGAAGSAKRRFALAIRGSVREARRLLEFSNPALVSMLRAYHGGGAARHREGRPDASVVWAAGGAPTPVDRYPGAMAS